MTKLAKARKDVGKTQEAVAYDAGMSKNGYRKLERDEVKDPHIPTIYGVSRAVNCDPHEIDEFKGALARFEHSGHRVSDEPPSVHSVGEVIAEERRSKPSAKELAESLGVELPDLEATRQKYDESEFRPDMELFDAIALVAKRQMEISKRLEAMEIKIDQVMEKVGT